MVFDCLHTVQFVDIIKLLDRNFEPYSLKFLFVSIMIFHSFCTNFNRRERFCPAFGLSSLLAQRVFRDVFRDVFASKRSSDSFISYLNAQKRCTKHFMNRSMEDVYSRYQSFPYVINLAFTRRLSKGVSYIVTVIFLQTDDYFSISL